MSTPISISGNSDFEARLDYVLRGRKLHPWGAALGLKPATITRLRNRQFPDPEKLMPACRVENLSLSWLLYGMGTPYLVTLALDGAEALDRIEKSIGPFSRQLLIAYSNRGWLPVLNKTEHLTLPDGSLLEYRATEVIGGNLQGLESLLRDRLGTGPTRDWAQLSMHDSDWRRLATGYMGSVELFSYDSKIEDSLISNLELPWLGNRVEEAAGAYGAHTLAEREALSIVRVLDRPDQSAALRMLRGLAIKHQD
jgi:hypothetical protein